MKKNYKSVLIEFIRGANSLTKKPRELDKKISVVGGKMFKKKGRKFSRFIWAYIILILLLAFTQIYSQTAVQFDGSNDSVTSGQATSTLSSSTFTNECWTMQIGAGVTTSTGNGGVTANPLITKGRGEAETPANLNMNYFLGITAAGLITTDFEDKATCLRYQRFLPADFQFISTMVTTPL